VRVLQWNIQWCRGVDGVVDPKRIVDTARKIADFDLLCVQEVAINFPALAGSTGEDQAYALSALLQDYEPVFAAAVDVPGGQETRRRFGNMIFSRYPVQQIFRHTLPWPAHAGVPSMPRVALEVVVETPLGALRVISTHLEYYSDIQRAAQVERLRELHAEACGRARAKPSTGYDSGPFQEFARPAPAILCGDFNLPKGPADPAFARLQEPIAADVPDVPDVPNVPNVPDVPRYVDSWSRLRPGVPHPPTFCVHEHAHGGAPYCCDFVFVSEDLVPRLKRVEIDVETQASDHQPVLVELDID
jgi:endonuclease/exonuclease/phosphatase family metal-dependent hydrolase